MNKIIAAGTYWHVKMKYITKLCVRALPSPGASWSIMSQITCTSTTPSCRAGWICLGSTKGSGAEPFCHVVMSPGSSCWWWTEMPRSAGEYQGGQGLDVLIRAKNNSRSYVSPCTLDCVQGSHQNKSVKKSFLKNAYPSSLGSNSEIFEFELFE